MGRLDARHDEAITAALPALEELAEALRQEGHPAA